MQAEVKRGKSLKVGGYLLLCLRERHFSEPSMLSHCHLDVPFRPCVPLEKYLEIERDHPMPLASEVLSAGSVWGMVLHPG